MRNYRPLPDLRVDFRNVIYCYPSFYNTPPACEFDCNPSIVNGCERCNSYKSRNTKKDYKKHKRNKKISN